MIIKITDLKTNLDMDKPDNVAAVNTTLNAMSSAVTSWYYVYDGAFIILNIDDTTAPDFSAIGTAEVVTDEQ